MLCPAAVVNHPVACGVGELSHGVDEAEADAEAVDANPNAGVCLVGVRSP